MSKIIQNISELLDGVRNAYIEDQTAKGVRSSGQSAKSLRKVITPTSGSLFGAHYFYQQRNGRRPGKFPPISAILDWIRIKGITPRDSNTTERQLAFLFARKIANSGTDIFMKRRPALDVDQRIQELFLEFRKKVAKDLKDDIKTTLI